MYENKIAIMLAPYFEGKLIDSFKSHRSVTSGIQLPEK